jgi:5'(3')-deoxyribonucleotidase
MKKRIFIDMDGVLARFYDQAKYLERMWEKDFFWLLEPYTNTVDMVKELLRQEYEIYILSACNPDSFAMEEKDRWLDLYLPEIPQQNRLFCYVGENKADKVPNGIRKGDVLIDDYTHNLLLWEEVGGTGVKFINNVNGLGRKGPEWNGAKIAYDDTVYVNIEALKSIMR